MQSLSNEVEFVAAHQSFIAKRLHHLARQSAVKRIARLIPLQRPTAAEADPAPENRQSVWFAALMNAAFELHRHHHTVDPVSGKRLSVGVIRVAHVDSCIALTRHLLDCPLPEGIAVRVVAYHSRQVLLLRSEVERVLNGILNRKPPRQLSADPTLQHHLHAVAEPDLLFIVVATPVEEVGRDHDFDWAVIEPSSMRSIIQMAGRVMRHRTVEVTTPNIALPQYNLNGWIGQQREVFCRPGYESPQQRLESHDLAELVDLDALAQRVDAAPRITAPQPLQPQRRLIDLEHRVLQQILTDPDYRPQTVKGWCEGYYYLTDLAQQLSRFRQSEAESRFILYWDEEVYQLRSRSDDPKLLGKKAEHVTIAILEPSLIHRIWIPVDYGELIEMQSKRMDRSIRRTCEQFGEVALPDQNGKCPFIFIPELGFQRKK